SASLGVVRMLFRSAVEAFKAGQRAQVAWKEELHDRPEVGRMVLDRSTGHRDAEFRAQYARGARRDSDGVLNGLRFVEDHAVPFTLAERGFALEDPVGREHEVHVFIRENAALPVEDGPLQAGRVLLEFLD